MSSSLPIRENSRWAVLAAFVLVVALLGGSSRYDAIQLAALRPFAALFVIPALYWMTREDLRRGKPLVLFLALIALWTAIQLVPLPPSLWQSLPGRDVVGQIDRLVGLEGTWRPISLVPTRGWNALAALIIPAVTLLLALSLRIDRRMALLLVAGLVLLDGVLGLTQIALGPNSALYFYAITNSGAPVGLFANENHSAMFSALGMIVVGYLARSSREARDAVWLQIGYAATFLTALLSIFAGGSRFGFVMAIFAIVVALLMIFLSSHNRSASKVRAIEATWLSRYPRLLLALFAGLCVILFGAFFASERLPGFDNLFRENVFEDVRWQIWPILEEMIGVYWLVGVGFGSFEEVFHIHETTQSMRSAYLNQAHNDWAQLVIEGGLPAIALLLAFAAFVFKQLRTLLLREGRDLPGLIHWLSAITVISAASLVDYPLRTPVFQMAVVLLLFGLMMEARKGASNSLRRNPSAV